MCILAVSSNTFAQNSNVVMIAGGDKEKLTDAEVLVRHLPDWENKEATAVLVYNPDDLRQKLGNHEILNAVEFFPGTQAVIAEYEAGKLLLIEYDTPQASTAVDQKVKQKWETRSLGTFYRRTGNYNIFLFQGQSEASANALFDKIKYEKVVQWLGTNPNILKQKERAFITGTMTLFVSTVQIIAVIFGLAIIFGLSIGIVYYMQSEKRRAAMSEFSDAGGMTRLNLDGLTPDMLPERLLEK